MLPSSPTTTAPGDCAVQLEAVEDAINASEFLGNRAAADQANLLATLDDSEEKLAVNKYDDAIAKLVSISDKAVALARASKPKLEDSTGISTAVSNAVSCISGL